MMKLTLAIQKSGRLHEDSMRLLKECGIDMSNGVNKLKADASNFPLELYFLRDDDIPQYVEDNVADIGFVGENVVREKKKEVISCEPLGFGKCRLSIAVKKGDAYNGVEDLKGKKFIPSVEV
jgi:ATP phosphoribosyltransferase